MLSRKIIAAMLSLVLALSTSIFIVAQQATAKTLPSQETNLVLICQFADNSQDSYNKAASSYTTNTVWTNLMAAFNSTGSDGEFKNYILTATNGKLNVNSIFPQDNGDGTMTPLKLTVNESSYDMQSDYDLLKSVSTAFNAQYPGYSQSFDNVMIVLETSNSNFTSHESTAGYSEIKLGNQEICSYEVLASHQVGGLVGMLDAVPAHEFLHSLGARDLYRINGTGEPARYWDIMASAMPGLLPLAQTRSDIGAITLGTVATSGEYTLDTATSGKRYAIKFKSPLNDEEYFVAEYRKASVTGSNGYVADKRLGNKSAYDTSGSKDGLLVYRVNPEYGPYENGGDDTGNTSNDYIYVFRPNDTNTSKAGGDSISETAANANIAAGSSIGSTDPAGTISTGALCYSDGTNSLITINVKSVGDNLVLDLRFGDYSSTDIWNTVNSATGSSSVSSASGIEEADLIDTGNGVYGFVSNNTTSTQIIKVENGKWSIPATVPTVAIHNAKGVAYNGKLYICGQNEDEMTDIYCYDGTSLTKVQTLHVGDLTSCRICADNGKLYVVLADGDTAYLYDAVGGNQYLSYSGQYFTDGYVVNGQLILSDFFANNTKVVDIDTGTLKQTISFTSKNISAATLGDKTLVLLTAGTYGQKAKLYEMSNGTLTEITCPSLSDYAMISSSNGKFYISAVESETAKVFVADSTASFIQLGNDVASPASKVSKAVAIDGSAYVITVGLSSGDCMVKSNTTEKQACEHVTGEAKSENIVAATCQENGSYDSVVRCTKCNAVISSEHFTTDKVDHSADAAVKENIVPSTCIVEGTYDEVIYCKVCQAEMSRTQQTLPLGEHTIVIDKAVPATRTSTGLTEGKHCSVCNKVLVAQKETPMITVPERTIADGEYVIRTELSRTMAIDIAAVSKANGANAQIWTANYCVAQLFDVEYDASTGYYTICNVGSGKCLTAINGAVNKGNIDQRTWSGSLTQKWLIEPSANGSYIIASAANEACVMDIYCALTFNGTNLQMHTRNGSNAQKFNFVPVNTLPSGTYRVALAKNTGKSLDIAGVSKSCGTNAWLWDNNMSGAQGFRFVYDSSRRTYEIYNVNSGMALDVSGGRAADGTNVQQWTPNHLFCQQWRVIYIDGSYVIASDVCGYVLDVWGGNTANGSNIQIWSSNNTMCQRWSIRKY